MTDVSPVALVTGASGGIGAEIARRLARDGFAVAVHYARSTASAEAVVAEIRAAGGRAEAVQADPSDPAAAPDLFVATEAALGPVQTLVNNAGAWCCRRSRPSRTSTSRPSSPSTSSLSCA